MNPLNGLDAVFECFDIAFYGIHTAFKSCDIIFQAGNGRIVDVVNQGLQFGLSGTNGSGDSDIHGRLGHLVGYGSSDRIR